jgi:selenocysteine-specific elongation factor
MKPDPFLDDAIRGGSSAGERLVLGTAGHIDHGKTSLVRALTGVDTDRLPEEKARGITIELGFAPLELPGVGRLSVVDVPGHERLVRTMVAGASGIDLVLLVVAADEGVMPQTREHLAICELLGLERGVVALTRIDLAPPDVADLAEAEVRELVAAGRFARAPVVRVSSVTGEGLDGLRARLAEVARGAAARTPRSGPPRLGVDRAFVLRGFGTVVTGTLVGGPLRVGQGVEVLPAGHRARVRGLQSHGAPVATAPPGVRTAVNLQGIELGQVHRGDVVSAPDALALTRAFDARVRWLPGAPPLVERASVELLAGTSERRARVAPIGAPGLAPGTTGAVRVHVAGAPLALLPGDRVVLRGFARLPGGGTTVGGGEVLDVAPARRRRGDPVLVRELAALAQDDPETGIAVRVGRAGLAGLETARLRREIGLEPTLLDTLLGRMTQTGRLAATPAGRLLAPEATAEVERRVSAALAAFHAREPLRPGVSRGELAGALPDNLPADVLDLALARLAARGQAVAAPDGIRLAAHRPAAALGGAEHALLERIRAEARDAGLAPPALREWSERLGCAPDRLRALLAHLERENALVHAPGDFWFDRAAVDGLRERLVSFLRAHGAIETPAYKQLVGTSRKHAVPLMELFDAERLTLRVGNRRVLRSQR